MNGVNLRLSVYETIIFVLLAFSSVYMILAANVYLKTFSPDAGYLFFVSLVVLVFGILGWIAYVQLGKKISYEYIETKYLIPTIFIVLGAWILGYTLFSLGIYESGLGSTLSPDALIKYLGMLAPVFLIVFAYIENLFFCNVIPVYIIENIVGVPYEQAKFRHYIIAAVISGVIAAITHIAWKPIPAIINTFIYFTSWSLSALMLRSTIFADIVHSIGNAVGLLYIVINPEYIIWSLIKT